RGGLLRVVLLQRLLDGLLAGDDDLDVVAGEELDVVDGVDVRRVAHRQDQRGAGAVHRNALVLLRHVLGHQPDDLGVDVEFLQVDGGDAVLLGEEVRELGLLDEAELGEVVADAAARLLLLLLGLLKLLEGDQVFADEQLAKPTSHRGTSPRGLEDSRPLADQARKLPEFREDFRRARALTCAQVCRFLTAAVRAFPYPRKSRRAQATSRAICSLSASTVGKRRSSRTRWTNSTRSDRPS